MDSTAPSTDEVELVIALDTLVRAIVEHNRRLLTGEPVDWDVLTGQLGDAVRDCRRLRSPAAKSRAAVTRRPTEQLDRTPIYG